jgi:RimJ/RimL family protein N-acetyltransferase
MVTLVPMTEAEFRAYLDVSIADYAEEHTRAGNWQPEEALRKARESFDFYLPNGLATEKQHLYTIVDDETDTRVGTLWFGIFDSLAHPMAFLLDFVIGEPYRRQGHATRALQALEDKVRSFGLDRITLHVFAHNHAARALYQKMGYVETDINMAKSLAEPPVPNP